MRTMDRLRVRARAVLPSLFAGLLLAGCISGGGGGSSSPAPTPDSGNDAAQVQSTPLSVADTITKSVNATPFSLTVTGGNGGTLSYASDNTAVASVSGQGLVTVVGTGTATLTVTEAAHGGFEAQSVQITLSVVQPQVEHIVGNGYAFAALRADGSVVTWGDAAMGGDSSTVASDLDGSSPVVRVVNNYNAGAFAALRTDGSVVTWGDSVDGGDSSAVAALLDGSQAVVDIVGNGRGFSALRNDGSVVIWGSVLRGGVDFVSYSSPIVHLSATEEAFTALRADGKVVVWGKYGSGSIMPAPEAGEPASPAPRVLGLSNPERALSIATSFYTDAALFEDGSVDAWGGAMYGAQINVTAFNELKSGAPVVKISGTFSAFAALRSDGSIVTWGDSANGGDSSAVSGDISGLPKVTDVYANGSAFAALREDGSVVTWGTASVGGDSSGVATELNGSVAVVHIANTEDAFAALRADGSVVTWGDSSDGGDSSGVAAALNGSVAVVHIASTKTAFAALREDGSVITWGRAATGGNSSAVAADLDGTVPVTRVYSNGWDAFAALRADGSVVTWGEADYGGDSSSVAHLLTNGEPLPLEDTDADGISNGDEWATCTVPYASDAASLGGFPCLNAGDRDTDGDGVWDDFERFYTTDPLKASYQDRMGDLDLNGDPDFWIQPSL